MTEQQLHNLLTAERPHLVRFCAVLTGQPDSAEDLAQEALLTAWRQIRQLRDAQAIHAWLRGIARNLCARHLRAEGRLQTTDYLSSDQMIESSVVDPFDVDVALERHELATLLDHALALLPADTRAVLVQRYVETTPPAEIAARLGVTENVVAVRLHRGRLTLRRLLGTQLRSEAETFGLVMDDGPWHVTRIWCTECGQHRLHGKLTADEFALRCPRCAAEPTAYHSQATRTPLLADVKTFRPAYRRFAALMHTFFETATTQGAVACRMCGVLTPLRSGFPFYAPPSVHRKRGIHVWCDRCRVGSYESLDGFALSLPVTQRFFRAHPRLCTLPLQEVEAGGVPALVVRFQSVTDPARFEVVMGRDTYTVLEVHEHSCAE